LVESIEDAVKPTDETVARQARQEHGEHLPERHLNEEQLRIYIRLYGDPLPAREEAPPEEDLEAAPEEDPLEIQRNREAWDSLAEIVDGEVVWEDADPDAEEAAMDAREADAASNRFTNREDDGGSRAHPFTQLGRFGTSPSTVQFPQATFVRPIVDLLASNPAATPAHLAAAAESVFGGVGLPYSPSTPARSRQMEQRPVALRAGQARMPPSHADAWWVCVAPQTYAACAAALAEARRRLGSGWVRGLFAKEGGRGPSVLDVGGGGAGVLAWRDVLRAEWEAMREEEEGESGAAADKPPPPPLGRATVVAGSNSLRVRAAKLLDDTTFIPRLPDDVPMVDDFPAGASPRRRYDVVLAPHTLWHLKTDVARKRLVETLWALLNPEGGVIVFLEKGTPRGFEAVAGVRAHVLANIIEHPGKPSRDEARRPLEGAEAGEAPPRPKKDVGMLVAPCTNHATCPLYRVPGEARNRRDVCAYAQRYIRPPFLQRVLRGKRRNHDDVSFSYVVARRGVDDRRTGGLLTGDRATTRAFSGYGRDLHVSDEDVRQHDAALAGMDASGLLGDPARSGGGGGASATGDDRVPNPLALPRLIRPPLKRAGLVLLDVCTPSGAFERWLVSRRAGRAAWRDARKAKWGDLWALGAQSRDVNRRLAVGTVAKKEAWKLSRRGAVRQAMREEDDE
jgi:ribosomal protein RSM22 (predicted rRNA methylase)